MTWGLLAHGADSKRRHANADTYANTNPIGNAKRINQ